MIIRGCVSSNAGPGPGPRRCPLSRPKWTRSAGTPSPAPALPGSGRPILLRIETKAGHGAGKPLTKQIKELTDIWSFLLGQLGL